MSRNYCFGLGLRTFASLCLFEDSFGAWILDGVDVISRVESIYALFAYELLTTVGIPSVDRLDMVGVVHWDFPV